MITAMITLPIEPVTADRQPGEACRGYVGDCPWEVDKGNAGAGCGDGKGCPYC